MPYPVDRSADNFNKHIEAARAELSGTYGKIAESLLEEFTAGAWENLEWGLTQEQGKIGVALARRAKTVNKDLLRIIGRWPEAVKALLDNEAWREAGYPLDEETIEVLTRHDREGVASIFYELAAIGQLPIGIKARAWRSLQNRKAEEEKKDDIRAKYAVRIWALAVRGEGEQLALLDLVEKENWLVEECIVQWREGKRSVPRAVVDRLLGAMPSFLKELDVYCRTPKTIIGWAREAGYERGAVWEHLSGIEVYEWTDAWIDNKELCPEDEWILLEALEHDITWLEGHKYIVQAAFQKLAQAEKARCLSRAKGVVSGWLFEVLRAQGTEDREQNTVKGYSL